MKDVATRLWKCDHREKVWSGIWRYLQFLLQSYIHGGGYTIEKVEEIIVIYIPTTTYIVINAKQLNPKTSFVIVLSNLL